MVEGKQQGFSHQDSSKTAPETLLGSSMMEPKREQYQCFPWECQQLSKAAKGKSQSYVGRSQLVLTGVILSDWIRLELPINMSLFKFIAKYSAWLMDVSQNYSGACLLTSGLRLLQEPHLWHWPPHSLELMLSGVMSTYSQKIGLLRGGGGTYL